MANIQSTSECLIFLGIVALVGLFGWLAMRRRKGE